MRDQTSTYTQRWCIWKFRMRLMMYFQICSTNIEAYRRRALIDESQNKQVQWHHSQHRLPQDHRRLYLAIQKYQSVASNTNHTQSHHVNSRRSMNEHENGEHLETQYPFPRYANRDPWEPFASRIGIGARLCRSSRAYGIVFISAQWGLVTMLNLRTRW